MIVERVVKVATLRAEHPRARAKAARRSAVKPWQVTESPQTQPDFCPGLPRRTWNAPAPVSLACHLSSSE